VAAAWLVALLLWLREARARPDGPAARVTAVVARWAPAAVVLAAALLRLEAVVDRYWLEAAPAPARGLARAASWLHPEAFGWEPKPGGYGGDPREYLDHARRPRGLFEAHHREPLFVLATRLWLALTGGADVAVSLASACFSTLAVAATFLLGRLAFGRAVGTAAALALAVERDAVSLAADGWRDDAFAFFFLASGLALLRLRQAPSVGRGLLAGALAGLAGLTRVTALSFLVPALLWAAWPLLRPPRRARARSLLAALAAFLALLGPYLAACWLRYGDPLFPISVHTSFYRERAGLPAEGRQGVVAYLAASRPAAALADTVLAGLTRYPFANKWRGFDAWNPDLGRVLAAASLVGLAAFVAAEAGRYLLLLLGGVLVPYAATWDLWGEWRFTLPAYPIYLLAAAHALVALAGALATPERIQKAAFRRLGVTATVVAAGALALALVPPARLVARCRAELAAGQAVRVAAGDRDRYVFVDGWQDPLRIGLPAVRFSRGAAAALRLPLNPGRDHALTLRVDPFAFSGAPPQSLRVSLGGRLLLEAPLAWNPKRIGTLRLMLPRHLVRGDDRLELRAAWSRRAGDVGGGSARVPDDWDTAFCVWYVRIEPR
jgi:hypothetical protein